MAGEVAWILLFGIIFLAMFAVIVLAIIFWIKMIIDCVKRKFKNENEKIVWIIILAILQIFGALIYYFVIKIGNSKGLSN